MFVTVPASGSASSLKRFTTAVRCSRGSSPSSRSSSWMYSRTRVWFGEPAKRVSVAIAST